MIKRSYNLVYLVKSIIFKLVEAVDGVFQLLLVQPSLRKKLQESEHWVTLVATPSIWCSML